MEFFNSKRGQVALFVIFGILIVFLILLFVFMSRGGLDFTRGGELGPREFVANCVKDAVSDSVESVMGNGGMASPWQTVMYKGEKWNYLCYQADYYTPCYNLYPMLEMRVEEEIRRDSEGLIRECFDLMREEFEGRGYDVKGGTSEYSIDILPGYIQVNLDKPVQISSDGKKNSFSDFDVEVVSPAYDLLRAARDVVNSESTFCHFEYNGYMLLYPEYNILRVDYRDNKMYTIIDRDSGVEFKFAVRSCVFPPGI